MKKKLVKRRWPYFFGQRIHGATPGNMPELIKPEAEWPRTVGGIKDILRWADDGGNMLDFVENRTASSNMDDIRERKNKR